MKSQLKIELKEREVDESQKYSIANSEEKLKNGSVVLAAITSCTNTSNPYVMITAGLVARKANELGLKVPD